MKDPVISVRDFRKTYGDFVAVDGTSFEVQQGEIFGLLGPNGAGKTSTLESLGKGCAPPTVDHCRSWASIPPASRASCAM